MKDLKAHRKEERAKERVHATARNLKEAVETIDKLETELAAVRVLKSHHSTMVIKPKKGTSASEATAVACLSDVHVGNHFTREQMNGINEYNVHLARERCKTFFERVVRLTQKERQDVHIEELVLFLGGDFIDGALHLDTIMSNDVAEPVQQVMVAQDIIESGIKYLEAAGDFSRITLICKDGNHGRFTHKQHYNSRIGNSLEWYMYYTLAARYPQFNWVVQQSILTYFKIYEWTIRFHHGDTVHFGGMNGFYQNLHRKIAGENNATWAHLDVLGHLHQYTPLRQYVVNGSVVGYSPYAETLQTFNKGESARQAFFLIDKKRFTTVHIPILL